MTYELKTRSERRARILAGGTGFKAKDIGVQGNLISIQVIEQAPGTAKFIATNLNTTSENVVGDVNVDFLSQSLNWNEKFTIISSARGYSISSQIADATTELGDFYFGKLFRAGSKLSVKLSPKASNPTPTAAITIVPRTVVIDLVWVEGIIPGQGAYDAQDLGRKLANSWVKLDSDVLLMTPFEEVYLKGGDGLPETPAGYEVSPTASLVILNLSEDSQGNLVGVDKAYQWVNGWVPYST